MLPAIREQRRCGSAGSSQTPDPGDTDFPDSARPREKICVSDLVTRDRIAKRARDMFLTAHVRKRLRPKFASKN